MKLCHSSRLWSHGTKNNPPSHNPLCIKSHPAIHLCLTNSEIMSSFMTSKSRPREWLPSSTILVVNWWIKLQEKCRKIAPFWPFARNELENESARKIQINIAPFWSFARSELMNQSARKMQQLSCLVKHGTCMNSKLVKLSREALMDGHSMRQASAS